MSTEAADRTDHPAEAPVALRSPTAMDQLELVALAHRLGETVPEQPVVVAAVDGRLVAARSVRTGVLVYDRDGAPAPVRDALRAFSRGD
ncbi:MAG: hypothetical protein WC558_15675 [Patulibacter sp.]